MGRWRTDEAVVITAGPVRVAVLGRPVPTADRLRAAVAKVRTLDDADALAPLLPGSCHLAVSMPGRVRLQGSVTGLRRVYHVRADDVDVAADRADVLAALSGAGVDEQVLITRLVGRYALPPPLNERPLWQGVTAVPPDHCLIWDDHRSRHRRWWRAPEPVRSRADGAEAVRTALEAATAPDGTRVSADLSGGMDSTSLCFLAARHTPELLTFRWGEGEAGNDDAAFAAHAIEHLPDAEHVVLPLADRPAVFDDFDAPVDDVDEPYLMARTVARIRYSAAVLAGRGSRRHLAGHGGDELFTVPAGYLPPLLRRRPITALRHVRAHAALRRWPLRRLAGGLLSPGTVATWWREQAAHLTDAPEERPMPLLGWGGYPLRAPEWLTPEGTGLARDAFRQAADEARPLAADQGQHRILLGLRSSATSYRLLIKLYGQAGIDLVLPYMDDRVVEAVLAVAPHEHSGPWRYKPLLADAVRGIVPETILGRATKGTFSHDLRVGLARNRAVIRDFLDGSLLAERGLIDLAALRRRLARPERTTRTAFALEALLGCETWLRTATAAPPENPWRTHVPAVER